jgi:NTE family protein
MKQVALVLGSGGARGLAHIGVIEELEERGYEIKQIAGSSMGALVGGVYAANHLGDFKKWICNLDKFGVYNLMDFTLTTQGFIKGDKVFNEIKKFVLAARIEDLKIPFSAVAVDLHGQETHEFHEGDLFEAIRASIAIPSVLTPVYFGDKILVDGGVMNPLPLDMIKKRKDQVVVAVDLNGLGKYKPVGKTDEKRKKELEREENRWMTKINKVFSEFFPPSDKKKKHNYFEILNLSFDLMQSQLTIGVVSNHKPDVLISVPKSAADTFAFFKGEELIEYGRAIAAKALDDFEKNNDQNG